MPDPICTCDHRLDEHTVDDDCLMHAPGTHYRCTCPGFEPAGGEATTAVDNDVDHGPGQRRPGAGPAKTSVLEGSEGGDHGSVEAGLASTASAPVPPLPILASVYEDAVTTDPLDEAAFMTNVGPDAIGRPVMAPVLHLSAAKRIRDEAIEDALAEILADFAAELGEEAQP